jgi:cytochrome c1
MKKNKEITGSNIENKKSFDIDIDTVADMMERIEGLSYEGQRQIIAYLKAQVAKKEKELKRVE